MRATLQESSALQEMVSTDATSYLRATGWTLARVVDDRCARYQKATQDDYFEVDVPLRTDLRDYRLRMAELLQTISTAEARPQIQVLRDIQSTARDIVRFGVSGDGIEAGRIDLERGVQLVANARDVMLAGACAALDKRAVFGRRKPTKAMEFLRHIRMGPTESGSFVLAVESPLPPPLVGPQGDDLGHDAPFSRTAVVTLAHATDAARRAALSAAAGGSAASFVEAVAHGVTSNLCDGVARLLDEKGAQSLEISFAWSRSCAVPAGVPSRIRFGAEAAPVLRQAACYFRETSPQAEFELIGLVADLSSQDPARGGVVTVLGFIDESARRVRISLDATAYKLALRAHGAREAVRCEGELAKEGRGFVLENPRQFSIHNG